SGGYRALPDHEIMAASFCGRPSEASELASHASQGQARVFGHHRVFIATQFFEYGQKALFIAVAQRDRNIAAQAVELCAFHRRTAEYFAKFSPPQARQPLQIGIHQLCARLKFRQIRHRGFTVPRANVLANIAAEYLPPDAGAEVFGRSEEHTSEL